MKYFKLNDEIYAFELDGSQDHLITDSMKELTDEEKDRHLNPDNYLSDEERYQKYLRIMRPLTRKKFRKMCIINDIDLNLLETRLSEDKSKESQLLLIDLEDSTDFYRSSDLIKKMIELLSLNEKEFNSFWELALTDL